jgi:hypothetical protein
MIKDVAGGDIGGPQKILSCERPRGAESFSPARRMNRLEKNLPA